MMCLINNSLKVFLSIGLVLLSLNAVNQNKTTVKFQFDSAVTKDIRINKIVDYISEKEINVARLKIENKKSATLSININEITEFIVYVDFQYNYLYLSPNSNYTIKVLQYNKTENNKNPFQQDLLYFKLIDNDLVNTPIWDFDYDLDKFIYSKLKLIPNHDIPLIINYKDSIMRGINRYQTEIIKQHIEYSLNYIELIYNSKTENNFIDKTLIQRPVLYKLPAYINFVSEVNKNSSILISNRTKTRNRRLYELAYLDFLKSDFYRTNNRTRMLSRLEALKQEFKYDETKLILDNLIAIVSKLQNGSDISNIEMFYNNTLCSLKNMISLSEKPNILFFYNSAIDYSVNALHEIQQLPALQKFQLIAIDMCLRISKSEHKSDIYYPTDVIEAHNTFMVRQYPNIIIVDNQGKIIDKLDYSSSAELSEYLNNEKFTRL